jgi:hypothetical protein
VNFSKIFAQMNDSGTSGKINNNASTMQHWKFPSMMQGSFIVGKSHVPLMAATEGEDAIRPGGKSYLNTSPNFSDPCNSGSATDNIKLVRLGIKDEGENPLEVSQIYLAMAVSENQLDSHEKPKVQSKLADISRGPVDAKANLVAGHQ